jgi:hypothetical protein
MVKNKKNNDTYILSTDNKIILSIKKHINDDIILKNKFNHYNNKYELDELLKCILIILKTGISYRNINGYTSINWNTVYKFHCKLIKYNIFENTYDKILNKYLTLIEKNNNFLYSDTTFICNKLGVENISFNQQIKKHKVTKISIISDDFNIPISVITTTGSIHDSKILNDQLDVLNKKHKEIFNQNKIILADAAYDSELLKNKVKDLNLGKLITPKNKRNSKITTNCENTNIYEFLLLKKRISIEHIINNYKQLRRCQLRYDKYIKSFNSFVYLASLSILIKRSTIYLN